VKNKDFDFGEEEDHKNVLNSPIWSDSLKEDAFVFAKIADIDELNKFENFKGKKFNCN